MARTSSPVRSGWCPAANCGACWGPRLPAIPLPCSSEAHHVVDRAQRLKPTVPAWFCPPALTCSCSICVPSWLHGAQRLTAPFLGVSTKLCRL